MNKLKVLAFSFLLVLYSFGVHSQEIIYSPYEDFDLRMGDYAVAGKVGDLLYVYHTSAKGAYLEAYNEKMEKQATVILDFFSGKIYDAKFVAYANQLIVLYQSVESGKVTVYAALLDEKGRLIKRPIVIDAAKQAFFGSSKTYFNMAVSDDKKKILVYEVTGRGKTINADCTWLDDQLTILSKSHASFTADNELAYGEVLLNNDGTMYLPVYTPVGSRSYADQVWLLTMPQTARKFTPKEVPLNNMFASGTYSKLDNNKDRIYVAGFYSEKKNGGYDGILYTYYDIKTGEFESMKLLAFDEELRNNTGERNKKQAFNDYKVRNLIVKTDGGFVLVSEDAYLSSRNTYSPGFGYYSFYYPTMSSSVREYHFNDVMILSYDAEGQRQWKAFVRKEQYSQEDGGVFSSYAMMNTGGSLGFLFNDFNSVHSRIQLAVVDADSDGKVAMKSLRAGDIADWLPRYAKQVSARELVVPCFHKREICFAKIVF